jgi:hypothetical protein
VAAREEDVPVADAGEVDLAGGAELRRGVLADRRKQPVPQLVGWAGDGCDERLVDEPRDKSAAVDCRGCDGRLARALDQRDAGEVEVGTEDGEAPQRCLLWDGEASVAPLQGSVQIVMSLGYSRRGLELEQLEVLVETGGDLVHAECSDPGRRQLDASGTPSSRRQIRATARAVAAVTSNPGRAARARCAKRAAASKAVKSVAATSSPGGGVNVGTLNTASPAAGSRCLVSMSSRLRPRLLAGERPRASQNRHAHD